MKTSIVAVIAASIFLAAAYLGFGSAWKPPGPPQMIVLAGPSSSTATPTTGDLSASPSSSPAGASQVLAVGRQVQQGSLKDLASRATPAGSPNVAAGLPAATSEQPVDASINATVEIPGSASGAPNAGNPGSTPVPSSTKVYVAPTRTPKPRSTPTPRPIPTTPTPTPTPTPVTVTVTPPVTSTVTPSSAFSPTPSP